MQRFESEARAYVEVKPSRATWSVAGGIEKECLTIRGERRERIVEDAVDRRTEVYRRCPNIVDGGSSRNPKVSSFRGDASSV
jgi:hypothetical protein